MIHRVPPPRYCTVQDIDCLLSVAAMSAGEIMEIFFFNDGIKHATDFYWVPPAAPPNLTCM